MTSAAAWMQALGWKQKLAKKRDHEQSLFEHSLIKLDMLLELFPILGTPQHYGLNETEKHILAVAVIAYDLGKETVAVRFPVSLQAESCTANMFPC